MNKIKFCFDSVKLLANVAKTSIGIGWKLSVTALTISNKLAKKSLEAVDVVNNLLLTDKNEHFSKKSILIFLHLSFG